MALIKDDYLWNLFFGKRRRKRRTLWPKRIIDPFEFLIFYKKLFTFPECVLNFQYNLETFNSGIVKHVNCSQFLPKAILKNK